ncbi:MAG: ABC transporter [Planctomycetota bacterium]|nr:MAG: ABC transporter [Planctomycetota bacterium]
MIKVKELTKRFGQVKAVDKINFEVSKGEVVGFLGVNGAGKTTTMRMLNSYLTPTSGSIMINGFCTHKDSLKARMSIGYMPENTPLPQDLRVDEYLRFRSLLKKVKYRNIKKEITTAIDTCLLGDVKHRVIGTISKGYQQRVALSDALLNNPPILILDEPTVGLDPNQIKHIRKVIQEIGKDRTVLLSTHIMQEVESICSRIMIMHQGKLLICDTLQKLKQNMGKNSRLYISSKCDGKSMKAIMENIEGVNTVYFHNKGELQNFTLEINEFSENLQEEIFKCFVENKSILLELKKQQSSLEDIFVKVTNQENGEKTEIQESLN